MLRESSPRPHQPDRTLDGRHQAVVATRWLLALALVASSWASGSVTAMRVCVGRTIGGSGGPVMPTEEQESESTTTGVAEAGGGLRRVKADHTPGARLRQASRRPLALHHRFQVMPGFRASGHRLSNGLLAPLQT